MTGTIWDSWGLKHSRYAELGLCRTQKNQELKVKGESREKHQWPSNSKDKA